MEKGIAVTRESQYRENYAKGEVENVRLRGLLYGKDLIKYDNSSDIHYTLSEV